MGYIVNTDDAFILDAVLTDLGKEILAISGSLNITKFAVSDDEIDYTLYNFNHPSGSLYAGAIIENTPIIEANTNSDIAMRFKLYSEY